jgi:diguanylate cyclase (GGDEF)-like protein
MRRTRLLAVLLAAAVAPQVHALDPRRSVTQHGQDLWQTEQGLPQERVNAILESREGYLWIGTMSGLARFDGARFVRFDRSWGLTDNRIRALAQAVDGSLWVGAEKGVTQIRGAEAKTWGTKEGLSDDVVWSILADPDGSVWVGTENGLNRIADGRVTVLGREDGLPSARIQALAKDRDGALWIGTGDAGLARLAGGEVTVFGRRDGLPSEQVSAIHQDRAGTLWVGTYDGRLARRDGSRFTPVPLPSSGFRVAAILEDRDGNLWVGGPGLVRLHDGQAEAWGEAQGLSSGQVLALCEDHEGSLWVGTHGGGLNRLRDGKFTGITKRDGLSHAFVKTVAGDERGNVWIGTYGGGLNVLKDGKISTFRAADGLATDLVRTVLPARDGSVWVGTTSGLSVLEDGRFRTYRPADGLGGPAVNSILEARDGTIWIGTGGGLSRLAEGQLSTFTTREGLSSDQVSALLEDRSGTLWIGTYGAGLTLLSAGTFRHVGEREGLAGSTVLSLLEDGEGTVWIGTSDGGLCRHREGRVACVNRRQGLHDDGVFQILEDTEGSFWLSSNSGVSRVGRADVDAVLDGRSPRLPPSTIFGAADGMPSRQCSGGSVPNAWKSSDGRLWFATAKGLAVIDPERIPVSTVPPRVLVESVEVNGRRVDAPATALDVPAGRGRLEVDYTALSFLGPERVLFRYRLEGFETDWIEAGTRRTAYYTNLPAGRYVFRVVACNADGVWNETGASLPIVLTPRFHEGWAFRGLVLALLGAAAWGAYRARVGTLTARDRDLKAVVEEKTRGLVAERERAEAARAEAEGAHAEAETLRREAEGRREELARKNRELHRANLQLERALRKLESLSTLDPLTGLPNRRHFEQALEEEAAKAGAAGTPLALVVVAVDHLALLNEQRGSLEGDRALKTIANVAESSLRRAGDLAARIGGSEFALLVPSAGPDEARALGEDVRARVAALDLAVTPGPAGRVSVSVGAAAFVPDGEGASARLRRAADAALARSLREGRNRVTLASARDGAA